MLSRFAWAAIWVGLVTASLRAQNANPWAIELDGLASYYTSPPFSDASSMFGAWQQNVNGSLLNLSASSLDALNYPTYGVKAESISYLHTYPGWHQLNPRPTINYQVTWDDGAPGGASLSFIGRSFASAPTATDLGNGHTRYSAILPFQYNADSGEATISLQIDHTNISAGASDPAYRNPVRNVHITPQQYINAQTGTAPTFRSDFVRKASPFTMLRMMDWQQTTTGGLDNLPYNPNFSDSREINWSDRSQVDAFSRTTNKGIPYEEITALANFFAQRSASGKDKKDIWINIPDRATTDYVTNLASFLKNNLDPSVTVYVEYSNELWNTNTDQRWQRVLQDAKANGAADGVYPAVNDSAAVPNEAGNNLRYISRQAAKRLDQYSSILRSQLGSRVKPVLSGVTPAPAFLQYGLEYLNQVAQNKSAQQGTTVAVSDLINSIAIAPYTGGSIDENAWVHRDGNGNVLRDPNGQVQVAASLDPNNPSERDAYLNWLFTTALPGYINGDMKTGIQQHKQLASQYGVKLDSYEGGQHLVAFMDTVKDNNGAGDVVLGEYNSELKNMANRDPRMATVYNQLLSVWESESAINNKPGTFTQFSLASPYSKAGSWGLLEAITDNSSVKFSHYLNLIAGDANLDGKVNFSDFQIIEGAFNLQDSLWTDGDFNLDGKVDYLDFQAFASRFVPDATSPIPLEQQQSMIAAFDLAHAPEPGTLGLLTIAAMHVLRRKARSA